MAVDIILNIDGVTGESLVDGHTGEIDILAWSWGMTQSGTTHMGPGAGGGKVNIQDITMTKYVDLATNDLIKKCCDGTHIASADLYVRKAGGASPIEYLVINFKEILVSSYSTGGSEDGLDRVQETFSLNFAEFTMTYTKQNAQGAPDGSASAGWNIPNGVHV